ncbi:hypothetical protein NOV18_08570 [Pseudomonas asiatica]|uniref:Restriction endonuclease n=1 Tax=Pseudomonas asiatica TaxID=2219225 RepID=A0AAJ5LMU2_9PSED|nr:hypothetical protein [Pseudomonas asiatica]UUC20518.1 hypothetical protein NOV18_08570 [Pseudomonas asiatica]
MNMQVKCPPIIDMAEVEDLRRDLLQGFDNIDPATLELITDTCLAALKKVDWNAYNEQRFGRRPVAIDDVIFLPSLPPVPKPYRSWPEVHISKFGGLKDLEYEPKSHKVKYVIEHTYQPDWVDAHNDRIFFEAKGVIPTLADAAKYRAVSKHNDVHFVFILQERDVICPFARPRKDGTRMTHEEWVEKEGFDYCYQGEEGEFLKSARYRYLVENFGKGLPRLEETLRANSKK